MYYIDTNICIYFLNGKYESVMRQIASIPADEIRVPAIVKAELLHGAYKSQDKIRTVSNVEKFLSLFEIEAFADDMADVYAEVRAELDKEGTPIGPDDLIIAATVLSKGGTLVTHNTKEFKRVKGLNVLDWVN